MNKEQENIIRKLFEGTLKPEERERLNDSEAVDKILCRQWEEMSEKSIDPIKEERILAGIMKKVNGGKKKRFGIIFYQFGIAAMVAICMLLSVLLVMKDGVPEVIYVMNTGHQSMDSVKLADGTKVMLSAGSRLTYPKEFSGSRREVTLSGQAFFDVSSDEAHPFVVKTQQMDVTVLGTSFEVFSFDGDEKAEAILLTGKVRVEMPKNKTQAGKTYILTPNEKLAYSKTDGVSIEEIDADAYSAWRQGKRMSFKNETLEMILDRLEKWYGQKIECDPEIARHYRFTFSVHSESLDLILNYISHSAPLSYKLVSNDSYLIEEKK